MTVREFLKTGIVLLDGGMGTVLQTMGISPEERSEEWNLSHSDSIISVHKAYYDAGSNIVCSNTFGANSVHFDDLTLEEIIKAALFNVKEAARLSENNGEKFAALDIGPLGKLLKPFGELDFETAVSIFAKTVKLGVKYGADLIVIETMNDSYETKAALLAAKENSDLPVFVTNAYSTDGKLMTGATPKAMVAMLEGMGADAIGANCSNGPEALLDVLKEITAYASVPVIFKPNAGLPSIVDGKTVFDIEPVDFALQIKKAVGAGARIVGGCCGTNPKYIAEVKAVLAGVMPQEITFKNNTLISSYTHTVEFSDKPILIGERINPTGKKRLKQALMENDLDFILKEGIEQCGRGADVLDVNVGLPEIDEKQMLVTAVSELQAVCDAPLQIDTSNVAAMEAALRIYNGKPLINSVNGKEESMNSVFPLAKKYGGVIIALTLDESGIPDTADGRIGIAKKILETAERFGIDKKNIVFDPLAMALSADKNAACVTLETVKRIREELHCFVSLGVSNVSFGLPQRDTVNAAFFGAALQNGLNAAIMNPYSTEMMKAYRSYMLLKGLDENCKDYIAFCETLPQTVLTEKSVDNKAEKTADLSPLSSAIVSGRKEKAATLTKELLKDCGSLEIINDFVIPALDIVGQSYEKGVTFLPQLLMSAESAKAAFEVIKSADKGNNGAKKAIFVIATVKGDIHDIGKNIVKLLLENYGFDVIDLGRDTPPEKIVEKALETKAPFVGLSALMTTTLPSMEETVKALKEKAPWCKIVVGGAVLTEEYAKKIGADKYSADAMETVRYALSFE